MPKIVELLQHVQQLQITLQFNDQVPTRGRVLIAGAKLIFRHLDANGCQHDVELLPASVTKRLSLVTSHSQCTMVDAYTLMIKVEMTDIQGDLPSSDGNVRVKRSLLLEQLSATSTIQCRQCHTVLAGGYNNTNQFDSVKEMPSEHWKELLECWMCHPGQEVKELKQLDLQAQPGTVLVGNDYIICHLSTFRSKIDHCPECGNKYAVIFHDNVKIALADVRLTTSQGKVEFVVTNFWLQNLWHLHRAHGESKFLIQSTDSNGGRVALLIWVMQWDVLVAAADSIQSRVRVCYKLSAHEQVQEVIQVSQHAYLAIIGQLEDETRMMPAAKVNFHGYSQCLLQL